MARPRIVLLHATTVAVEPVLASLLDDWPDAEPVNLLDDSLPADRARTEQVSPDMIDRFVALCRYAERIGADGLLATCSAFGPALDEAARVLTIPVLKPNEAMFEAALERGDRIGMICTFGPSVSTMEEEFREAAGRLRPGAAVKTILIPEAMAALRAGDAATHNRLIAERGPALAGADAIMLGHFSTSRASRALQDVIRTPVLTAPGSAVAKMRRLVTGAAR